LKTKSTTRLMPARVQLRGQLGQLLHGAQRRVDLAVAADRVAAVVVALRAGEQRHQVQVGQAQLLEVGDLGAHALQVPGEQIDITHAAQHLLRLEPVRVGLALRVQRLEPGRPRQPGLGRAGQDLLQVVEEVVVLAVEVSARCAGT
jgi:hypothetical protein